MKKKLTYILMITLVVGSLTACQREPYSENELNSEAKKAESYLEKKYPGHTFTVTAENDQRGGAGVPTSYAIVLKAEDENGTSFKVTHTFDSDDPLIMQFFVKHWDDDYDEKQDD